MGQVETFIIKLKDMFSAPLHGADAQIEHTREKFMGLKEMVEGAVVAYGIERGIEASVEAYNDLEQAVAQVRQGIITTNGAAGKSLEDLQETAEKLSKVSLFDDAEILKSSSLLLTFPKVAGDVFDRAQQSVLDLSTRMGGDLSGASVQLGKALQDPILGIQALRRVGVSFSESQRATIKNLVETNQLAKAQGLILNELDLEFGGSAKAASEAGTGGWKVFKNAVNETQAKIGGLIVKQSSGLLPMLKKVNEAVLHGTEYLSEHAGTVKTFVGLLGGLALGIGSVIVMTKLWAVAQGLVNLAMEANPIGLSIVAIAALGGAIYEAYQNFEGFRVRVNAVWDTVSDFGRNVSNVASEIKLKFKGIFDTIDTPENESRFKKVYGWISDYVLSPLLKAWKTIGYFIGKPLIDAGKGIYDKYSENVEKEKRIEQQKKNVEYDAQIGKGLSQGARQLNDLNNFVLLSAKNNLANKKLGGGVDSGTMGSGLSEIKTGAPKTFNINIGSFIKEYAVNTTTHEDSLPKTKEKLLEMFLSLVNDVQIIE